MQIIIHTDGIEHSTRIDEQIETEVQDALRHFADQVTRVEVHVHDVNGPKSGHDKRCVMEVRLAGHQPLAVDHTALNVAESITGAAGRLERAVRRKLERHDEAAGLDAGG